MIELGQLERQHEDFTKRGVQVIAVSMEGLDDAGKTQAQFPHLTVLSDQGRGLSEAAGLVHAGAGPDSSDTDVPTTILVDRQGIVRWLYCSPKLITRLSPDEMLQAIDDAQRGTGAR
jgi:alkyl hydroperoxide reductase subunit AhpC